MRSVVPILTVLAAILALWYAAAVWMNSTWTLQQAERAGEELSFSQVAAASFGQDRPKLPMPHQVGQEMWKTTGAMVLKGKAFSKRSLLFHGWITLSATLMGFAIGTGAGILLAIGIVHSRTMDMSVMPWAIVSQTIPIIAIAPMIIVVLYSIGVQGTFPKAVISAYLSFFPVVVGMVKGLRAPDAMQLDLLRTYSASRTHVFWKLRLPASLPYLFASLKIAMAASLIGAIVGELPTGAVRGLGARLLSGTYYGQTVQIWSALFTAALLAALLVAIIALVERVVLKRMGMQS
ncbi:ABC transporter permease [Algirhabdus cladophorae]|uniref:ABC transporter permease n=1 Tax=Algirhabdus cladophorae TaxID=3377108 RepID=UPI003B84A98A